MVLKEQPAEGKRYMASTFTQSTACGLDQAKEMMAVRIKEAYASLAFSSNSGYKPVITRVAVPVKDVSPLSWLTTQRAAVKTYWSDRQNGFEMAGIGAAHIVSGKAKIDCDRLFGLLNRVLTGRDVNLRYYGGLRFTQERKGPADTPWESFGSYRFLIPQFELFRQPGGTELVCNVFVRPDRPGVDAELRELEDIVFLAEPRCGEISGISGRFDSPDIDGWTAMVEAALESIDKAGLDKLVLARQTRFDFSVQSDPLQLLERLRRVTPQCYHFGFQLRDNLAFIGATPERLYHRLGRKIETEALGGTRPRDVSAGKDKALGEQLRRSEKDLREHQYVVERVQNVLEYLCRSISCKDGVRLLKLGTVQHLITRFEGMLASGISDADILPALHPTPAVAGCPKDLAVEKIRQIEPFDRGWYAGTVGWVGHDAADFAVAIRSGLVANDKLYLFAGAGIVPGSVAVGEWQEVESKLSSFTKVLKP